MHTNKSRRACSGMWSLPVACAPPARRGWCLRPDGTEAAQLLARDGAHLAHPLAIGDDGGIAIQGATQQGEDRLRVVEGLAREGVLDPLPVAPVLHQARQLEEREVLGHRGGREPQDGLHLAAAEPPRLEELEDPGAGGIAGRFECQFQIAQG